MTHLPSPWIRCTQPALMLSVLLATVACGGSSISTALSLTDSDQPINDISISPDDAQKVASNSGDAAQGKAAVTAAALTNCPDEAMTPAEMNKLSCIVGRYQGMRVDEDLNRIGPPGEKCYMSLPPDGRMSLQTPGVFEHQHQFSGRPLTDTTTEGSRYKYSNRGSTNFTSDETGPLISLQSRFSGTGSITLVDQYEMKLGMYPVGTNNVFFWFVESTINDHVERCTGQLAIPPSSPSGSSPA